EVGTCGSEGWLKRKIVAAAMESQREVVRWGKKGTVAVGNCMAARGGVGKGGTSTVGSGEGCGKG
ncbi:hypothetical protein GW17_00059602, partial [Ensete ventricosum]